VTFFVYIANIECSHHNALHSLFTFINFIGHPLMSHRRPIKLLKQTPRVAILFCEFSSSNFLVARLGWSVPYFLPNTKQRQMLLHCRFLDYDLWGKPFNSFQVKPFKTKCYSTADFWIMIPGESHSIHFKLTKC